MSNPVFKDYTPEFLQQLQTNPSVNQNLLQRGLMPQMGGPIGIDLSTGLPLPQSVYGYRDASGMSYDNQGNPVSGGMGMVMPNTGMGMVMPNTGMNALGGMPGPQIGFGFNPATGGALGGMPTLQ